MSTILLNVILLNTKYILIFINIRMTQCSGLNVKLSNSQLNKFKPAIKNENEVVLRLSSNITGDNKTNFPHKLLIDKFQIFVKPLQIIHQLILSYQKLNYLR